MIAWGGAIDHAQLYFDVRLAEEFPTVEIRVADVCTEVEDAVLVATLARALVAAAAIDRSPPTWRATCSGSPNGGLLGTVLCRPRAPVTAPWCHRARCSRAAVDYVRPALVEAEDLEVVDASFRATGLARWRRHPAASGVRGHRRARGSVVEDLARRTEESWA